MRIIIALFLALSSFFLCAQQDKMLRIELETAKDADDYDCIPIGKDGVIVFYEGYSASPDTASWVLMHYDTNLVKIENTFVKTPANLEYITAEHSQGHLIILFQEKGQRKIIPKSYYLDVNLKDKIHYFGELKGLSDYSVNFFKARDNHFFIISYEKDKYTVALYNRGLDTLLTPDFSLMNVQSIEFCEIDTFNNSLLWGLVVRENKGALLHLLKTNFNGKVISDYLFPAYTGYYYSSARLAVIDSVSSIIMGTYTDDEKRYGSNMHTGVYTLSFKNNKIGDPEYFSYTHRSRDSVADKKNKNKNINYQLLVGDIFPHNGKYSFVTEVFYPEYSYNSDPYYYGYGMTTSTFEGYRYINAYVTTFDKDGHLLCDHFVPFSNILSKKLIQPIGIFDHQSNTVIYYLYNMSMTSTLVNGSEVISPLSTVKLSPSGKKEMAEYNKGIRFEKWYNDYFILSGYQYLRNISSKKSKTRRYVFFVNKLQYR